MTKYQFRRWFMAALLAGLVLLVPQYGTQAWAQEEGTTYITSPADGETVSGLITVTGAADFDDFLKYEVLLKSGDDRAWAATVYAPVVNGNLARIDTRTYLDGVYQLVIRQVNSDSNYTDYVGPTINIQNGLGAPLPHPEIESSFLYAPEGAALARVKNCSGRNMEFDYIGEGSCSAGNLWIMPKEQDSPVCTSVDILLQPCEYRGTAVGEGETRGVSYSFVAEAGKIYQLDFPGGDRLFIGEIPGDERASTDTGGTPRDNPAVAQPPATAQPTQAQTTKAGGSSSASAAPQPDVLPVSGQGQVSNLAFITAAVSLILLLIVGGVLAVRKRRLTA